MPRIGCAPVFGLLVLEPLTGWVSGCAAPWLYRLLAVLLPDCVAPDEVGSGKTTDPLVGSL